MSSAIASLQESLRNTTDKLNTLKRELQSNQQARQQLLQQKNENVMVLEVVHLHQDVLCDQATVQELNVLTDDANVYKLIGPALIKQDPVEAKSNVRKRLEFIESELTRSEHQFKSLESKINEQHRESLALQKKIQSLSAKKGKNG